MPDLYEYGRWLESEEARRLINPEQLREDVPGTPESLVCNLCLEQIKPYHQDECVVCRMRKAGGI